VISRRALLVAVAFTLAGMLGSNATGIQILLIPAALASAFVVWESLLNRNFHRADEIRREWPSFVEYLVAALESGITPHESLVGSAEYFEGGMHVALVKVRQALVTGDTPGVALLRAPSFSKFHEAQALSVRIQAYLETGAPGFAKVLRSAAIESRQMHSLDAELKARLGWVLGTARLGVLSPWVMLALLCQRPESRLAFASSTGQALLLAGTLVCAIAYALILKRANYRPVLPSFWMTA